MNPTEIQARAKLGQERFKEPYKKIMERVEKAKRDKWLACIITFFNVAESETWEQKTEDSRNRIAALSNADMKSLCKELCTEAINRDFVSWVSTGSEGNVGRDVYNSLA